MGAQGAFQLRPFAGADQPVVEHGRQQQQHERHHRRRHRAIVEQPRAGRPQQQPAVPGLGRREAGEGAEHQREHLAVLQPGVAAEHEHAGPGQDRIGDRQARRCAPARPRWDRRARSSRRPAGGGRPARLLALADRAAASQARFAPPSAPVQPFGRIEDGAPRIDEAQMSPAKACT